MLIRSQDKKSLINMSTVSQLYVDDDNNITADFNNSDDDGFEVIGRYSTEAKAIKVLNMIQSQYMTYIYGPGGKDTITGELFQPMAFNPPKVFQMSSDEEVEA